MFFINFFNDLAIGWFEYVSPFATNSNSSSSVYVLSSIFIFLSSNEPNVSVPVLSNTILFIFDKLSK